MALSDLGASSLNEGIHLEETQAAVVEKCSKRRKEGEFTKELVEGEAQKAVENVVLSLQAQVEAHQRFLLDDMNGTVERAVNNAVTSLTSDLHNRVQSWEGQVETQIDSRIQHHWEAFEKKWEDKIVQLEPGSEEGTITMAQNRICTNVQKEMEKVWRERMDREDKITTTNIETPRSEVRLEVMRLSARLSDSFYGQRRERVTLQPTWCKTPLWLPGSN